MKKTFQLTALVLLFSLLTNVVSAQSTNLCDGIKFIYNNLTKSKYNKLPENYASTISGWKEVVRSNEDDSYGYTFEYKIKKGSDIEDIYTKLSKELSSCLSVQPESEGEEFGPDSEAMFEYKEGVIQLYQRSSISDEQWIMISVSRY